MPCREYVVTYWRSDAPGKWLSRTVEGCGPMLAAKKFMRSPEREFVRELPAFLKTQRIGKPEGAYAVRYYYWDGTMIDPIGFDPPPSCPV